MLARGRELPIPVERPCPLKGVFGLGRLLLKPHDAVTFGVVELSPF